MRLVTKILFAMLGVLCLASILPAFAGGQSLAPDGAYAANVLGTLASALIMTRALELVFTKFPVLRNISLDLSADSVKFGQTVMSRAFDIPPVEDFPAAASPRADVDVPVVINRWKQVRHEFTADEYNRTDRNLVDESAEPIAIAIGSHLMGALAALWTPTNFPHETIQALDDCDYDTVVDLRQALVERGGHLGRSLTVSAPVYGRLLKDTMIVGNDKNPYQRAIESGELAGVAGFQTINEYPGLPSANNLLGFAGTRSACVVASRVPSDPSKLLPGAQFPGALGYVQDPGSGFAVMVNEWIDPDTLKVNIRAIFQYGMAVGHATNGQRLVSAATASE